MREGGNEEKCRTVLKIFVTFPSIHLLALHKRSVLVGAPCTRRKKYTNKQMHKYTNVQIHKYSNKQIAKYTLHKRSAFGVSTLHPQPAAGQLTFTTFLTIDWIRENRCRKFRKPK